MLKFHRYHILALLYIVMALYIVILRKPFVITLFDAMLLSILVFDNRSIKFTSKIPVDRNLVAYLFTLFLMLIIHMDLASSLKEIIQMIEVYFFYIILIAYAGNYSNANSDHHLKFLRAFTYILLISLVISFVVDYTSPIKRNLLNFQAIPLFIIVVLSFFYDSKIRIPLLENKFYPAVISFFSLAVIYYENSRAALLFFVIFLIMLSFKIKKRYVLGIVTVALASISLFSFVVDQTQSESFGSLRYTSDGRQIYTENLSVSATRGLTSLQVIFENLDDIIEFVRAPDAGITSGNIYGSNYERLFQVKFVYQAFVDSPLIGLGPNKAAEIANVHGIMLVTLADFGLIGLFILFLYIFNSFRKVRRIARTNDLYDMFLYYYFIYSVIVLAFVSAGLLPLIPFIFISTLIHIRYHSLLLKHSSADN